MVIMESTFDSIPLTLLYAYFVIELIFYATFHFYLVPRANQWVEPHPYRNYGKNRHTLLFRILQRTSTLAEKKGLDFREVLTNYVLSFFDAITTRKPNKMIKSRPESQNNASFAKTMLLPKRWTSASSIATHSDESFSPMSADNRSGSVGTADDASSISQDLESPIETYQSVQNQQCWSIKHLGKVNFDRLLGWVLFGQHIEHFVPWEHAELQHIYDKLEKQLGLVFISGGGKQGSLGVA